MRPRLPSDVFFFGVCDRDEVAARKLWLSLPPVYRQCAVTYTDFWAAYGMVIPSKRHRAVGKAHRHATRMRCQSWLRKTMGRSAIAQIVRPSDDFKALLCAPRLRFRDSYRTEQQRAVYRSIIPVNQAFTVRER